jgi:hypothetical protein
VEPGEVVRRAGPAPESPFDVRRYGVTTRSGRSGADGPRCPPTEAPPPASLAGPTRIPGFHPEGRYEFKVHLDGQPHLPPHLR